ncbi:hypothetical protein MIR68_006626 [Amoeboaphelidium protococcarum]|nr:hypothetical protein MIR68_006626 [Amoeboaphelidium protococcarum]
MTVTFLKTSLQAASALRSVLKEEFKVQAMRRSHKESAAKYTVNNKDGSKESKWLFTDSNAAQAQN